MSPPTFRVGTRVEFEAMGGVKRTFRGIVGERLDCGLYWFVGDGEAKGRIVNGTRLRRCLTPPPIQPGGNAA